MPTRLGFSAFVTPGTLPFWHAPMLKNYLRLNLSLLYWVFVAPFTGQFFSISQIFRQMVFIGVRATSMVALSAFSIGVTLAMQGPHSLQQMGAEIYVPELVMLLTLGGVGTVLIAVILVGGTGSAVACRGVNKKGPTQS